MKYKIFSKIYLIIFLLLSINIMGGDIQYSLYIDYSNVTPTAFMRKLTLKINIGNCTSCEAIEDGNTIFARYDSNTKECLINTTGGNSITVTGKNYTGGATGQIKKATLYNDKKWAYSITFDDCRPGVHDNALGVFKKYGYRGGVAINTYDMHEDFDTWYMSWQKLDDLYNEGWSVFNHTKYHNNVTCDNIDNDIVPVKQEIENRYPGYINTHFVFPYNDWTAKDCLEARGLFLSAEVDPGYNYVDTLPEDLFYLYRQQMYGTDLNLFNSWLDTAANDLRPVWLISFSHNVEAGSTPPGTYDTNEDTLDAHLNYLYNTYGKGGNNSVWVAPSDEVLHYLLVREHTTVTIISQPTPTPTLSGTPPTATITPTLTITPTFTTTFTFTLTFTSTPTYIPGPLIDDFEDGEFTVNSRGGGWEDWADGYGSIGITRTVVTDAPAGNYAGKFYGTVEGGAWASIGISTDFNPDKTEVDLRDYDGLRLYMKGQKGTGTSVDFIIAIMSSNITDYSYWEYRWTPTNTWTYVEIPWTSFTNPGWGMGANMTLSEVLQNATGIQWSIADTTGNAASNTGSEWYIDNIEIYGGPTLTPTDTFTITNTPTYTEILTDTPTETYTETEINTPPETPTGTYYSDTFTYTETFTLTYTGTPTYTYTETQTPTNTPTQTNTPTYTFTEIYTFTYTYTPIITFTSTETATYSFTSTYTPTYTPTNTLTETFTQTYTVTITPQITPTPIENQELEIKEKHPLISYPNPYTGQDRWTVIFNLTKEAYFIELKLYTVNYRLIRVVKRQELLKKGENRVSFDKDIFKNLSKGIYYYVLIVKDNQKPVKSLKSKILIIY